MPSSVLGPRGQSARFEESGGGAVGSETSPTPFRLVEGDLIVLTGDMARSRDDWQRELRERGFVPWDAVTKKVKLVAAADPDSLSGKARKARDYGIPIVSEAGLADLLKR
jgi:DNA polymerase-3 subunit epsilon